MMRVLLVGSSFSAMPMLRALLNLGAIVTVVGRHRSDPCHSYGHYSEFIDYSDREALLSCCKKASYDYIVPTCNDYSYVSAAYVASQLGFPGFDSLDTTEILHTKDRFRRFCSAINIPAPVVFGEFESESNFNIGTRHTSLIIKPVDSFSGRGIQVVPPETDIQAALQHAFRQSRKKRVVVEQFVEGTLHSHTAFVASGRIVWYDFVDEFCEVYAYQVDRSCYPSSLSSSVRAAVNASMQKIVSSLKLCDGLLHTQFVSAGNDYWIIECMRRCPGDLYGHHFKLTHDFDYETEYLSSFIGKSPCPPVKNDPLASVERQVLSTDRPTALFGISLPRSPDRFLYVPLKESGDPVGPAPFDKAGIVFLVGTVGGSHTRDHVRAKVESYHLMPVQTD
jgi:formate-dependent phosphoribosylglycinamide formyltransferase (GAR transformylase)